MGFLDGLKNKISESGYADKVSTGLNKIGEGLQTGSEKIQSFASSLKDSDQQVIENDIVINDTHVPVVQEKTPIPVESNIENSVSQIQNNDYPQTISPANQRQVFSVNENDTNETRQIKEVFQDANTVVQSVNEVVNGETMRNFSDAAKEIARGIKTYKLKEQEIEAVLASIDMNNKYTLAKMDKQYEQLKPVIEDCRNILKVHRRILDSFDVHKMEKEDYETYIQLSKIVDSYTSKIMNLYDKITG